MKIRLNPDGEYVKEVKRALKANNGYCPCALVRNKDTKCICKEFREAESGLCRCGLYMKE